MKTALAHHWITSYRGGERVLEQIASLFPGADIHALVHNDKVLVPGIAGHRIYPSAINRLPNIGKLYRHLIPIHPWAIKGMRVSDDVDVLISSDASLIKGIPVRDGVNHVCYCHSPPRYLWEMGDAYKKTSLAARVALDRFTPMLRRFDYLAAQQVTHFIANSEFVRQRIARYYQRDAEVVYPPVAVQDFCFDQPRKDFFLVISELVPYKRIDIAVEAFNRLGKRLVVMGDGPERRRLESIAKPNVQFMGRQPFSILKEHLETARAFVFPGVEDFGITPVESQAAGCPVIAFAAGGALETVVDGQTGSFFYEQNADALVSAVETHQASVSDPQRCREQAEKFSIEKFQQRLSSVLSDYGVETIVRRDGSTGLAKVG